MSNGVGGGWRLSLGGSAAANKSEGYPGAFLLLGRQRVSSFVPMSETRYRRDPLRAAPGTDCHDTRNQSIPK